MPKYTCPKCSKVFDDLFDLSGCLADHNDNDKVEVVPNSAVSYPTRVFSHTPNRFKIDLTSLPAGAPQKRDLPILAQFRDKIVSEFFCDMPWKIPLTWSRRSSSLGRITHSTNMPFNDTCVKVECEGGYVPNTGGKRWHKSAYVEIAIQYGRDWEEILCTLTHELLHAYDYYKHGFWSKSWSQSHLGYFDTRKNSINVELKAMGSKINIAVKGGDRQMDGETETWLRANLHKGSHVYWEWETDSNKKVKGHGIVKRRNSHMVSIDAYGVEPVSYRHVDKIPWQKIKQIDGYDVVDWMNGVAPNN